MEKKPFDRSVVKRDNLVSGATLNVGNSRTFGPELPMGGEGWYGLRLRFYIAVTIGTGSGAIAESELKFIKKILFRTDRGEVLCNMPGRGLYKLVAYKQGSPSRKDAMAAASATYVVDLLLPFADFKMARPEDTILDTRRYQSCEMEITLGTVADLFTTVGTSSVAVTLDIDVERTDGKLEDAGGPLYTIQYDVFPPVDANSQTNIDMLKADGLRYKRAFSHECANGSAGVAFGGTTADDVKDRVTIDNSDGFIEKSRLHESIQNQNKDDAGLESVLAGFEFFDFVKDGSIWSAIDSGEVPRIKFSWTNKAGVAANDIVTLGYEALRPLRAKSG